MSEAIEVPQAAEGTAGGYEVPGYRPPPHVKPEEIPGVHTLPPVQPLPTDNKSRRVMYPALKMM